MGGGSLGGVWGKRFTHDAYVPHPKSDAPFLAKFRCAGSAQSW